MRFLALLLTVMVLLTGCGGGGGGTGAVTYNVSGQILWIETGGALSPAANVRIGTVTGSTDVTDGYFSIDAPAGATEMTVTYTPTAGTPIVRTFFFSALNADIDLGDLYVGPEEILVIGILRDSTNNNPVPGATVKLAGRTAVSAADGTFTLSQVAYSGTTLSVFLGLQGEATQPTYFPAFFNPPNAAIGGGVSVGTVFMTPEGSTTPPPLPSNVSGVVTPSGGGATVQAKVGANVIRTAIADGAGNFTMWLPAGTYTVTATKGAQSGSTTVTVVNVNQNVSVTVPIS